MTLMQMKIIPQCESESKDPNTDDQVNPAADDLNHPDTHHHVLSTITEVGDNHEQSR